MFPVSMLCAPGNLRKISRFAFSSKPYFLLPLSQETTLQENSSGDHNYEETFQLMSVFFRVTVLSHYVLCLSFTNVLDQQILLNVF